MKVINPWVNGAALAVLFAIIYVTCMLAVILVPGATVAFLNTWFHGIDLTLIMRDPADALGASDLISGFVSAVISAFAAGALYGWARNLFMRLDAGRGAVTIPRTSGE